MLEMAERESDLHICAVDSAEPCTSHGNVGQLELQPPAYVQPVQYTMPGAPMPVTAYERPPYPAPHSFLALVVFTLIICLVLNITSLVIGIPALIFSVSSVYAAENTKWKTANRYGKIALLLSIANWSYVLGSCLLVTGLTLGLFSEAHYNKDRYSNYYY